MQFKIVTRGQPKVRITEREALTGDPSPLAEAIGRIWSDAFSIRFTPWDTDKRGRPWGQFNLSEEIYKEMFEGKNLLPQFSTFEKTLAFFSEEPNYYFASPISGDKFPTLNSYMKHINHLQGEVGEMLGLEEKEKEVGSNKS